MMQNLVFGAFKMVPGRSRIDAAGKRRGGRFELEALDPSKIFLSERYCGSSMSACKGRVYL